MEPLNTTSDFHNYQKKITDSVDPDITTLLLCAGTGCLALGSENVYTAFKKEIEKLGLTKKVRLKRTGCHGFCEKGPLVVILPKRYLYPGVKTQDVTEILQETVINDKPIERLLYVDPVTGNKKTFEQDLPFYAGQQRNVFAKNGKIDPVDLEDYIANDGYAAFVKTLEKYTPQQVIDIVTESGLRGRGGGGFPAGPKWDICRKAKGQTKYLICNSDEGDPGAFMDRSILEGIPHSVLEAMLIAGYAIGASEGFIYVRAEYPLAVEHTAQALISARKAGLLGDNILGSDFSFDIEIRKGAGAFVCGEETALIASLEGKRGMPTSRPPYPAVKGYKGKPTCINNVETLVNVPLIINKGKDWFAGIGTEKSKGTKIFALAGKVANTGLVEVAMGTTLREIVFDIGGGIPKGGKFKAAQLGGPSGGCIPKEFLDHEIDYDSLQDIGAIMGSGGLIVMDQSTCMVDIARYFLEFIQSESCGKCTPCRVGTARMLEMLQNICDGKAEGVDLDELIKLGENIKMSSLCGLGQTAPNPVLSTIRHFKKEYIEHIEKHRCRAGVCKGLLNYAILDICVGCGACKKVCPVDAISGEKKSHHVIDSEKCIKCGQCFKACKFNMIVR